MMPLFVQTFVPDKIKSFIVYNNIFFLLAPPHVLREMCRRASEYTTPVPIRVAVGTYNVNGGKHFRSVVYKDVSLSDWLLDSHVIHAGALVNVNQTEDEDAPIDIFAIGFEEIVDLNASNIVAASSENARSWAEELSKTLSRDRPYALITYQQLVGVCIYIFVRPEHVPYIRDVAVDCVKTGFGGHTGNTLLNLLLCFDDITPLMYAVQKIFYLTTFFLRIYFLLQEIKEQLLLEWFYMQRQFVLFVLILLRASLKSTNETQIMRKLLEKLVFQW